jgi:uncharacterized membrane protein
MLDTIIPTNATFTARARESLDGQWGIAATGCFIVMLTAICISIIPVAGQITWFLLSGVMQLGHARFTLAITRGDSPKLEHLFSGFKQLDVGIISGMLVAIFTFLWFLLLIIPGLIAIYAYSMTFFLLADDANLSATDAISKSKTMMKGHKWRLFCLQLRLFGWLILGAIPCGIGLFWAVPYMMVSYAHFYEDLKQRSETTEPIDILPA